MSKKNGTRVAKTFRLSSETISTLEQLAAESHISQTEIIENLIMSSKAELDPAASNAAEITIKRFDEEYGQIINKLKTSAKLTDMNVQIILEMLNSIASGLGVAFAATSTAPSAAYQGSKSELKKQIEYNKQKSDWRK